MELLQLLLLILPLEFSLQALLVLFVFGEVEVNKQVTPKYTALVAIVSVYCGRRASAICRAICPILASSWAALASRRAAARLPSDFLQLKAF